MWLENLDELGGVLQVYPNPVQTTIQLDLQEPTLVKIKDLHGKVVLQELINPSQLIDIQHFESGLYIIEGADSKGKFVKI